MNELTELRYLNTTRCQREEKSLIYQVPRSPRHQRYHIPQTTTVNHGGKNQRLVKNLGNEHMDHKDKDRSPNTLAIFHTTVYILCQPGHPPPTLFQVCIIGIFLYQCLKCQWFSPTFHSPHVRYWKSPLTFQHILSLNYKVRNWIELN